MPVVIYRCRARGEDGFVTLTADPLLITVRCSCGGEAEGFRESPKLCDHIDATLAHGERAMVPLEDRPLVDSIEADFKRRLRGPPDWKADWQDDYAWTEWERPGPNATAVAIERLKAKFGEDYETRPKVCFTGDGNVSRKHYIENARQRGWRAIDSFQADMKVLVCPDPTIPTRQASTKIARARYAKIPVISYEEWMSLDTDGTFRGDS